MDGQKFPPQAVERRDMARLLEVASSRRDRALIIIMWRAGLRNNEVCHIDLEHVQFKSEGSSIITVCRPKNESRGAPRRRVGLNEFDTQFIKAYLEERGHHSGPLFVTSTGKRLHPSQNRRTCKILARKAGISQRIHPHGLRHTFSHEFYSESDGKNLLELKNALGHSNLSTTEKYLGKIGAVRAVEMTQKRRNWNDE